MGTIQPSIEIPPIGPHLLPFTKILGLWWGLQSPFAAMWMEIGWALYFQVVGTHKHYMWSSKFFLPQMVGTLKPSIEMLLLPLLPLAPFTPLCFLCSPSLPSLPFAPLTPLINPWPCPQVVGTIQPSIEIPPIGPHLLPFTKILALWWGLQSPLQLCEWRLGGHCTSRWWGHISTICDHQSFFCHRWWVP